MNHPKKTDVYLFEKELEDIASVCKNPLRSRRLMNDHVNSLKKLMRYKMISKKEAIKDLYQYKDFIDITEFGLPKAAK